MFRLRRKDYLIWNSAISITPGGFGSFIAPYQLAEIHLIGSRG